MRLQDFRMIDAPMWTIHLVACAHIYIDRLSIDNDLSMSNTDALDIDGCEHVWISNSYFSSADDGICLKTTLKPAALRRPTRHVVIQNCILRSL
ncbi:glycosyl hydrolase family 28 protein [Vibrio sp. PP-XX7]